VSNSDRITFPIGSFSKGPHELFEDQALRTPDAPALYFGENQLSYQQLNVRANRLAHFLRKQNTCSEQFVGVLLDRSFDSVVAFLAILKSGGAYFPLDPKVPKERLSFMLADSETSLLVSHSSMMERLAGFSRQIIYLDQEENVLADCPSANLSESCAPDQLAYLIYTSGSTGKPKGVMIPRRALVNFLISMAQVPGISSADTLLAVTTTSFDISILELLLPIVTGASTVIASSEEASDAKQLERLLRRHAVTIMQATPATWRMLVEFGWEGKQDLRILCGGEALKSALAESLLPRCLELWNMYGPTETTIWSSTERVISPDKISLGAPIANTQFHVLDEQLKHVIPGNSGELLIGGDGLARGYFNRAELTLEKFIADPFSKIPDARLYRTGDQVRLCADGSFEFIGRLDHQIKLNGFRIELGEIENALAKIPGISQAIVLLREDRPSDKRLVAYYTGPADLTANSLIQALTASLPDYMIPSVFLHIEKFPLTPNAKIDRKALPRPEGKRPNLAQDFIAPHSVTEKQLANLWCDLLQLDEVGIDDSFFDLGGNSLAVVRMTNRYHGRFGREIPPVKVFQYPTIAKLSCFLDQSSAKSDALVEMESRARAHRDSRDVHNPGDDSVAIIGMVGRFPGAADLDQLWRNLCSSVESISFFKPEELGPGIPDHLRNDPDYIPARGLIDGAELFDAAFFGISPLEAKVMDPQQRVFLELAQHALENSGYDQERYKGRIAVFAGIGDNHYYTTNLLTQPDLLAMAGKLAVEYGNQKDYIALRTAYLLDLRGPAISLNTACSTTLLAVDQAYRSLLDRECDMALSGGIDITVPQKSGFLYQEGGTFAKDGHCRPFDAEATGTMFCDGAGVVVLKRLADALADGDTIYAVICGTGKNNNGARPASFLAPSVDGQAEAIALAQANANVPVETIGYIEAHGTGTPVGDPIEFDALRKVFDAKTSKKHFCYVGSIKGNIGHPTNAAGVAGLIKTALVLHHEQIPPTLHFKKLNPRIDLTDGPFQIADRLVPFPRGKEVRRSAVSSFGFGGTNVHAILEEAPLPRQGTGSRPLQLLPFSAKSQWSLDAYAHSLAQHLCNATPDSFADTAFTFQTGRKQMSHRRFVVAGDPADAAKLLQEPNPLRCSSKRCERRDPPVVFLFGGQGTQYVNMGLNLYRDEAIFRAVVDDCCELLKPHLGRDLREILYPATGDEKTAHVSLQDTFFTQPSIFVIEYALARFWQSIGIQPVTMAGHSIGEFVAATLAGVWELEDALQIIALRGRLMQDLPRGSMMAVNAGSDSIAKVLPATLQLASNNAPNLCVVSGPETDVAQFQKQMEADNVVCRHLHTSHAFHSAMMDPMVEPLRQAVAKVNLRPPSIPLVSTVTGRPITATEATDPAYWANHARATVEFSKAITYLKAEGHDLFLECGPRSTLCSLTRQQFTPEHPCTAIPTFSDTHENNTEWATLLFALGSLWQNGVTIDWDAFYANEERHHIPLPTYPFERQRFWVDPATATPAASSSNSVLSVSPIGSSKESAVEPAQIQQGAAPVPGATRKDRIVERILDLLAPVSGLERSQINSSATFMEQGFDSLSLTQVAFAIRKEFSVKVTFSQLMNQFSNIDLLAVYLDGAIAPGLFSNAVAPPQVQTTATPSEVPAIDRVQSKSSTLEEVVAEQARTISRLVALLEKSSISQSKSPEPATHSAASGGDGSKEGAVSGVSPSARLMEAEATVAQRGIFASSCLSDHLSAAYNESMTVRFTGQISVEKLSRALEHLVARHDALRASFDPSGHLMHIGLAQQIPPQITDLSSLTDHDEKETRLRRIIAADTATPFLLPGGPLFRSQIVLLGSERAAVIFTAHHVICDGWSLDVMIHDLCAFYSSELSGRPITLSPAESYANYVHTVNQRQHTPEFAEASNYWRSRFQDGFPVLTLPADHARTARREFAARRVDQPVSEAVVQNLRNLAAKQGCSLFAVLLSALAILLARVSGQRRFVIALPTAEQPSIGQPGLVGHCVNLLPFVVEFNEGELLSEFFARIQRELIAAQDHAIFNMARLLENLRPVVTALGSSAISAGLTNVKKFKPNELPQSGFAVDYDANPKSYESFEFYLNAVEMESGLELRVHYDTKLFDELTIHEWLDELASILQKVTDVSSRSVLDLVPSPSPADPVLTMGTQSQAVELTTPPTPLSSSSTVSSSAQPMASSTQTFSNMEEADLLRALLPLWKRVLDTTDVSADDDFFALGGHSISAAQLFTLIQRELGFSAPLAILYDAATPRLLAKALSKGSKPEDWQSIVAINRSGSRPPLFLVHAAEGNILLYRSLAAHLGPEQPVYGLQSAGLDGITPIDSKFEHVAARYIEEIRQVQPNGPYMLGGYCLGGTLALEMARQLIESGESIGLLALIEIYNIRSIEWPQPFHLRFINRFVLNPYFHLQNLLSAEGAGKLHFFQDKLRVELGRMKVSLHLAWDRFRHRLHLLPAGAPPLPKLADIYEEALAHYDVKPYPGEITLFLAKHHLAGFNARLGGWEEVAQAGVRFYPLPISPRASLVEPFVAQLAKLVRTCLDEASEKSKIAVSRHSAELARTR
jgi:amino acid adenylation domain-containing protein